MSINYELKPNYLLIKFRMEYLDARVSDLVKEDTSLLIGETNLPLIIIDLSQVEFIDSSGFGVLISCLKKCRLARKELLLYSLTEQARLGFRMLNLDRLFNLTDTLP